MKNLIVGLALVAGFSACKSTSNVPCNGRISTSIGDASQCSVPEACHVTNEHRVCDSVATGCCQKQEASSSQSQSTSWISRNWWWVWGPSSQLRKCK